LGTELSPTSKPTSPITPLDLTEREYLIELARRLDIHARENCVGVEATREVGYAATVLRRIAKSMKGQTDDSRPEN